MLTADPSKAGGIFWPIQVEQTRPGAYSILSVYPGLKPLEIGEVFQRGFRWYGVIHEGSTPEWGPFGDYSEGLVHVFDQLLALREGIEYTRREWPVFPPDPEPPLDFFLKDWPIAP